MGRRSKRFEGAWRPGRTSCRGGASWQAPTTRFWRYRADGAQPRSQAHLPQRRLLRALSFIGVFRCNLISAAYLTSRLYAVHKSLLRRQNVRRVVAIQLLS